LLPAYRLLQHPVAFGYDHDSRTGVCFADLYEVRDGDGIAVPRTDD